MKKIYFTKMSGAGNDFIVVDLERNQDFVPEPQVVKRLCSRGTGIGADGLLTICRTDGFDFKSMYFNSDGSGGMLCGNGARCIVYFGYLRGYTDKKNVSFLSNGIAYRGEIVSEDQFKVFLSNPENYREDLPVMFEGKQVNVSYIFTGTDHVVLRASDIENYSDGLENLPVKRYGRLIRNAPEFMPKGSNVNFYEIKNDIISIRTYERGVEDETLACGTGAVATALVSYLKGDSASPVKLVTKSGRLLEVGFTATGSKIESVSLSGPAEIVFEGSFILEDFNNEKEQ